MNNRGPTGPYNNFFIMYAKGSITPINKRVNGKLHVAYKFTASVIGGDALILPERDTITTEVIDTVFDRHINGMTRWEPIKTDKWGREWMLKPETGEWFMISDNGNPVGSFSGVFRLYGKPKGRFNSNMAVLGLSEVLIKGQKPIRGQKLIDMFPSLKLTTMSSSKEPFQGMLAHEVANTEHANIHMSILIKSLYLKCLKDGINPADVTVGLAVRDWQGRVVLPDYRLTELIKS